MLLGFFLAWGRERSKSRSVSAFKLDNLQELKSYSQLLRISVRAFLGLYVVHWSKMNWQQSSFSYDMKSYWSSNEGVYDFGKSLPFSHILTLLFELALEAEFELELELNWGESEPILLTSVRFFSVSY